MCASNRPNIPRIDRHRYPPYAHNFASFRKLRAHQAKLGRPAFPANTTLSAPAPAARAVRIARRARLPVAWPIVRLVIARCSVDYAGRLTAHLPSAPRLLLIKADGSVSIHADDRAYKPLNWMSPPCTLKEGDGEWTVVNKAGEKLIITIEEVLHDSSHELGVDPGLIKDGVEAHLQELLADRIETLGEGWTFIRREYPTAIGPVDILCRDADGCTVAVEIKRRGEIDGVEQLTRYLELLNRDPRLAPVKGVFAAQEIKPQARVLATDRGIACAVLDYDALRGVEDDKLRLF
jgi:endonuclease